MRHLNDIITDLVIKKQQIEQYKLDHPDLADIWPVVEEYYKLIDEAMQRCTPASPMPYPQMPPRQPMSPFLGGQS